MREIVVLHGTTGERLARTVCGLLSIEPTRARVGRFGDGEVDVQILDNVRDKDVFVLGPTNPPAENLLELILLAEAAVGSSAARVTIVPSYLGYNRQDRKTAPRTPISARIPIQLMNASGANRVLLFDLHSEATMIAFSKQLQVDHLYASYVAVPHLASRLPKGTIVASPDKGGGPRASAYAKLLGHDDWVLFYKSREKAGEVSGVKITGDVRRQNIIFVDDMIDSGGTMIANAHAAKAAGAKNLYAFATHGILSGSAVDRLEESPFTNVFVTDSIANDWDSITKRSPKLVVISIAPLIAKAIQRLHSGQSLSELIPKASATG
jgi:ribose-phosphate pyrophosphokinase